MSERRISFWDVNLALHYIFLHIELAGSKRLAQLVSLHFLEILNFKAIENKNRLIEVVID
jgi:hypothetical protein